MAEPETPSPDTQATATAATTRPRRSRLARAAMWAGGILAGMVVAAGAVAVGIDTGPGHRLLIRTVEGLKPESGLRIAIGGLEGSLYSRLTVRNLVFSDAKGAFLTLPETTLDWRPVPFVTAKHLQIEVLDVGPARLIRLPELMPSAQKPKSAKLPDLAITVRRLRVGEITLEPAVTGDRRKLSLEGSADIANGDARLDARAQSLPVDGHNGGDRFIVKLDARPSANRLIVDAHLNAPQGGVVDRLAKLNAPLRFDLSGQGDWKAWDGRAKAALGEKPLLDAALTGRDGLFRGVGSAFPAVLLKGVPAQMTQPALAFDVSGRMTDRRLDGQVALSSDAFRVNASGVVDLGKSRFGQLKIDAALLRPEALAEKVRGRDVKLALVVDGPFDRPLIDYDLSAAAIGFDTIAVEALKAEGRARVDAERTLRLPLHATAPRITGLDQAAGGSLNALKIDGDILVSAKQIASDNLRLRSDRLDATVIMALSPGTGRYDAALKGRINRYTVPGVGVLDITTDAKLVPTGEGLFRVAGSVQARTTRIDNASALDILGGQATASAQFSRSPEGAFGVANLRLRAPKFQIVNGGGSLGVNGGLNFAANAESKKYGPLGVKVGGTLTAPVAALRAPRPNVGVQLTDLLVELRGVKAGYDMKATAGTPYGPLSADVGLETAKPPLTIAVRQASLAGLNLTGRISQTSAGPFAGDLTLRGSGFNGAITLAAADAVQQVKARIRARDARLPLEAALTIAEGSADVEATLYPNAPQVSGDVSLTDVRRGELLLNQTTLKGTYRGGVGQADLSVDGRTSVPFSAKASAHLSPNLVQIAGQGAVSGTSIRLVQPARLVQAEGAWRLEPAALVSPQGRLVVSGGFGPTKTLHARLEDLDLALAQAFAPTAGLNGKASGVLDVTLPPGEGLPTANVRLAINNFTRTGLSTVSEPVDISLSGVLAQGGGDLNGLIRRRGAVVGRLQTKLGAIPGGQTPLAERVKAASISGGLRYNGPAEVLWSLSGIKGQEVAGPLAIGADVTGRLGAPKVRGVVKSQTMAYHNSQFGTSITGIAIDGRFVDTRLDLTSLTARTPDGGAIAASGYADLSADNGFPIDIKATLTHARLARSDALDARLSGVVSITNGKEKPALISGELSIDEARYAIALQGQSEVVQLQGVRRKGEPLQEPKPPSERQSNGPPSAWKLDVGVRADNQVFVTGMGLEAEWRSTLRVTGDVNNPVIVGDVRLVRGTYTFAGRRLELARGVIRLDGSSPPNPLIDLEATTTVQGVTATIDIGGSANSPEITFSSMPSLPQDEVLSRLLFGASVTQLSPLQAVQLASALNSLRGGGGGLNPLGKLRQAGGLDRLRFMGADTEAGRGPSVGAGKYIGNNVYVEVTTDARGFTATQIEVALSKTLRLLSQVGALGASNISLRYSRDY